MRLVHSPSSLLPPLTLIYSRAMAKLLCLVALLLVASAMVAEAHAPAPPHNTTVEAPSHSHTDKHAFFSLKCIIHNLAEKAVKFKLVIHGKTAGYPVVAKPKCWTAIGPVKVERKVRVAVLYVTVKNDKGYPVTKSFPVKLKAPAPAPAAPRAPHAPAPPPAPPSAPAPKKDTQPKSSLIVVTVNETKSRQGTKKKVVVKVNKKVVLYF